MSTSNPPVAIEFAVPETSLSIGDIIGRSARIMRSNYRLAFTMFLIPELTYIICWEILMWVIENMWAPVQSFELRAAMLSACFLSIAFSVFLVRSAFIALWFLMTGRESSVEQALAKARSPRLLLIFLPTFIIDFIEAAWVVFLTLIVNELVATQSRDTQQLLSVTGLYIGLVVMWYMPFRMLALLNLFYAYNALVSESSPLSGLKKFFTYCRRLPLQLFWAVTLLSLVLGLIEIPTLLTSGIETILQSTTSLGKDVVHWLAWVPKTVLELFIGIAGSAITAAATVFFDNEWRIRLEGKDVSDSLIKLTADQNK